MQIQTFRSNCPLLSTFFDQRRLILLPEAFSGPRSGLGKSLALGVGTSRAFTRIATCRFCIDERAGTRIAFFKRGPSSRDGTISKKENQMKSKIAYPALAATALLALTQLAAAQGTSGGTGAIASIPGGVVRGHEQGHVLISIITRSTLPQPNASRETMTRRGQNLTPPK
jgi:hypothetical protein